MADVLSSDKASHISKSELWLEPSF